MKGQTVFAPLSVSGEFLPLAAQRREIGWLRQAERAKIFRKVGARRLQISA